MDQTMTTLSLTKVQKIVIVPQTVTAPLECLSAFNYLECDSPKPQMKENSKPGAPVYAAHDPN